jgi:UDP-N-acetylmuramate--alanine ligase
VRKFNLELDVKTELRQYLSGTVHFIGCGGAGMAPMAQILLERGFKVSGSDLESSSKTAALQRSGATVYIGHHSSNIPAAAPCLIVHSSAVKSDNPEMLQAAALGYPVIRRGEMLALLASTYKRPVAISGSHGKTSITAMLAHILRECGNNCGFMVGGKINTGVSSAAGDGDIFITEADESDGSHTAIHARLGIVPNVEDDHCWNVGGIEQLYRNFQQFAMQCQHLIYCDHENSDRIFASHPAAVRLTRSAILADGYFSHCNPDKLKEIHGYQRLNAAMAVAGAVELGITRQAAETAVLTFSGVARRMTTHLITAELAIIEDYAHHPTELSAALDCLKRRFPGHYCRVVFQPHRYARLRQYFEDFVKILRSPDAVVITPVFAAWVETEGVGSAELAKSIGCNAIFSDEPWGKMAPQLLQKPDGRPLLLAVIGAGDLEQLIPHLLASRAASAATE